MRWYVYNITKKPKLILAITSSFFGKVVNSEI
jgi:hypothetical protein